MASFAYAPRPNKFTSVHFKRWKEKAMILLQAMKVFWVSNGMPEGNISEKHQRKLDEANTIFVGYILGVLIVITWLMCTCT